MTLIIASYVIKECFRRRVFIVVPILTILFLGLFWFGNFRVFSSIGDIGDAGPVDSRTFAGSTMLGLSMFATLFLGAVLATFLTFTVVRGDAEQGLLQPLVVRPLGRITFLAGRFVGATAVSVGYAVLLFSACVVITGLTGGYWPDRFIEPALELAAAVAFIGAISMLGSIFMATIANGVAVLMFFGAGLVAGFMGQIGEALNSPTLVTIGRVGSIVLPFEALYQAALHALTADISGVTGFVVTLGPFGGGQALSIGVSAWLILYFVAIAGAAAFFFSRRDV